MSDNNTKPQDKAPDKQAAAASDPTAKAAGKKPQPENHAKAQTGSSKNGQTDSHKKAQVDSSSTKEPVTKKIAGHKTTHKAKHAAAPKVPTIIAAAVLTVGVGAVASLAYRNLGAIQQAHLDNESLQQDNSQLSSKIIRLQQELLELKNQDKTLLQHTQENKTEQNYLKDSVKQLTTLVKEKGQDPILWRFAEVEYLLTVANHRLLLERDVATAMIALADADKRLDKIGDPALIPIRKKIADELTALKSLEIPDVSGMSVRLSALTENIQNLPLISIKREPQSEEQTDSDTVKDWNEFGQKILDNLKGIVSLRRTDEVIEPLLPPQEQHYLSQNLGLKLEESRLALLRRDTAVFQSHCRDIREWVGHYFDKDSAAVADVINTVSEFEKTELKPQLPDVSGSLRELRQWVSKHHQQKSASFNESGKG